MTALYVLAGYLVAGVLMTELYLRYQRRNNWVFSGPTYWACLLLWPWAVYYIVRELFWREGT